MSDPDLLRAGPELALFDTFIAERVALLQDGFGAEWVASVSGALERLRAALFIAPDEKRARFEFEALERLIDTGRERVQAWEDVLQAAGKRADLATRADATLAKREAAMTESQLVGVLGKMLRIMSDVAGEELAGRVRSRFEVEVFGRVPAIGAGVEPGCGKPIPN